MNIYNEILQAKLASDLRHTTCTFGARPLRSLRMLFIVFFPYHSCLTGQGCFPLYEVIYVGALKETPNIFKAVLCTGLIMLIHD